VKRFDYLAPSTLADALALLAAHPEATLLAGGTNVLVQLKEGRRSVQTLLSLRRLPELHHMTHGDGVHIGAGVIMAQIAADARIQRDYTALATAAALLGSVQTRNMATVGGNLCNASPSADTAPPLLVLDATAILAGPAGERQLPLRDFFVGPGKTALAAGELLREIVLPAPAPRSGSAYVRHIPRAAMDISVAGVAAALALDEAGRIVTCRLALGAVAPIPLRVPAAEALLAGHEPGEALFAAAAELAQAAAQPLADVRASAEFRRHLVGVLARRALQAAFVSALAAAQAHPNGKG
jgi:carbon-monoxide dehydrogenase medium subunit